MSTKPQRSRAELEAENRYLRRGHTAETLGKTIRTLIRVGGTVAIVYFGRDVLIAYAGQESILKVAVDFAANVQANVWAAWLLAGGGISYGTLQRKARRDTIEQMQRHQTELEKVLDGKRTSSTLTTRGDTRPKDDP